MIWTLSQLFILTGLSFIMLSPRPISNIYQNRNYLTRIKTSPAFAPSSYCIVIVLDLALHCLPATVSLGRREGSGDSPANPRQISSWEKRNNLAQLGKLNLNQTLYLSVFFIISRITLFYKSRNWDFIQ